MKKKILIGLVIVLVLIQFIRPEKNVSEGAQPNDISKAYAVSAEAQDLLKRSCYDCHSNNTVYPWYWGIQPVAWWLNDHIEEGKEELNFNEFATYKPARQYKKMDEMKKQIDEGEMPLSSYTLIHRDALLSDADKAILIQLTKSVTENLRAHYPLDSLVIKHRD
jgi:hypothetical protein